MVNVVIQLSTFITYEFLLRLHEIYVGMNEAM